MPRQTKQDLKDKISILEKEKLDGETKLNDFSNVLKQKEEEFERQKKQIEEEKNKILSQKDEEFKNEKQIQEQEIKNLRNEITEKQRQIDIRELKKLAEAYTEQEDKFKYDADKWFKYVLSSFIIVILATISIILFVKHKVWYENLAYYFGDIVLITFLVFSLKQYAYYIKLRTDYANRKTLAQSYHNIINSEQDNIIKSKFLEKAIEVLCSRAEVENESYTIPEKILESITEVAKNLSKK